MEVTVNIIDTLFTTIPKNTVVASYTIDEDSVDLTMLNDQYSFNTANKTILTSSNVTSNNLKAINFTVRNWVSGEQVEINDMYPRVVSKLQNKFNKPNTIYKVTKDLDLNHCVLTIPEGCTLQFDGGSISNGSLSGNFTKIIADSSTVIFGQQIHIEGSWDIADIYDEWFWFDTDPSYISNDTIKNILALSNDSINNTVHFDANRTYYFELPYKGRANLGDDVRPNYWLLNTSDYDFLRIFTGFTSNTHLIVNNTIQMLPTNQGAYFIFHIENKENITISGTGAINGDAKDHLYTDPFAGTDYYGEWGHGISISSSRHIMVKDISISKCWGDGITIASYSEDNLSKDITIDNIVSTYNRRLGVSLISGDGIKFINSTTESNGTINGTAPKMGLDIEPNPNETLNHVLVDNCLIKDKGTCYIPSTASVEDVDYKIMIQNCNIPSQFNISGPCTFKGNRVRFAYISNVRYAEIQDNHIYENLIFAGTDSTPITNTKVVGNNITPLNNAAHNAAIVFDGSAVTLDKVIFTNNIIDLTKKSSIALQKGSPVNGRLNIENCVILGNKAEQQVYWTAGNIINSLIDSDCINIFNANSVEGSEVNFIGNTIIYYRENPFVIRDNITVNYNINIINNNIIPIGYTATDLINYVSHTFAGTIKSLGNNFLGKDPSTVGTYANRPTLTGSQIGRIYYMTDNSIPAFWNGVAWRDANGYPALKKKGTTAERPAIPSGNYSGYTYYDTTLNKYVLWNGTAWTNLDGTALT